jgi:glycosyltransferase involved in cell wall biosynthesis
MKFADRWLTALANESDYIVVLDTGSTDGTYEYLLNDPRVYKVEQKIITPWRFDTARNESLKLIPEDTDICVVSDFDQVFRPGWGAELRNLYELGYEEVYGDIIDYDDDNQEIKRFLSKNVHPNDPAWYWERPIHEGINCHDGRVVKEVTSDTFIIEHHPDRTKSRSNYLNLLEMEYKENFNDPMCAIYYGCELSFHGRNKEGGEVFLKAYRECDFSECPEIGYQICLNLSDYYLRDEADCDKALFYAQEAKKFGIITRRLFVQEAEVYLSMNNRTQAINSLLNAFNVKYNWRGWVEDSHNFQGAIEDKLSLLFYEEKNYLLALAYCSLALHYNPADERIRDNKNYFISEVLNNV